MAGHIAPELHVRLLAVVDENASTVSRTVERLIEEALDARDARASRGELRAA